MNNISPQMEKQLGRVITGLWQFMHGKKITVRKCKLGIGSLDVTGYDIILTGRIILCLQIESYNKKCANRMFPTFSCVFLLIASTSHSRDLRDTNDKLDVEQLV